LTDLRSLVRWYRDEWQAEMGSGRIHVRLTDPGGDPDWHGRFRALIEGADVDVEEADGTIRTVRGGNLLSFPIRDQLRSMARGGRRGHRRARFLFVLACQDFHWLEAARAVSPAGYDEHGRDWAEAYAFHCLDVLWRRMHDPERTHDDGRSRTFVERRIPKSEAQAAAEA
jgi:hypothetical protein